MRDGRSGVAAAGGWLGGAAGAGERVAASVGRGDEDRLVIWVVKVSD